MLVTIDKSKTDQESAGQVIAVVRQLGSSYCPIEALKDWLAAADIAEIRVGIVFH